MSHDAATPEGFAGSPETLAAIRKALEKAGVEFTNGKGPGVRMRVSRAAADGPNPCRNPLTTARHGVGECEGVLRDRQERTCVPNGRNECYVGNPSGLRWRVPVGGRQTSGR
jgi:hypothetical protein